MNIQGRKTDGLGAKKAIRNLGWLLCPMYFLLTVILLFISCSVPVNNETSATYTPIREQVSVDSLENNFSKAVWHMVNATEKGIEAVDKYVDISEQEIGRSANLAFGDAKSLGKHLPSDLSKLKRFSGVNSLDIRSAIDTAFIESETITLQDELDTIIAEYNAAMEPLVPNLDDVELPPGVIVEDGFINIAGGNTIYQHSLDGIATAEVLVAIANGEDPESAVNRITAEIESMFPAEDSDNARGFFINPIQRWKNGEIHYIHNPNMSDMYIEATENAMREWEKGSDGEVDFIEMEQTAWNWFLVSIGQIPLLRIEQRNDISDWGLASPGQYLWGIAFLYLSTDIPPGSTHVLNRKNVYSVALHELGHVLGLQHEQQRADRDDYIDVDKFEFSNMILPEETLTINRLQLVWKTKKVWFITIYYLEIVTITEKHPQFVKTQFDFLSIMLYNNLEIINKDFQKPNVGDYDTTTKRWETKTNTQLSDLDKKFIKHLY